MRPKRILGWFIGFVFATAQALVYFFAIHLSLGPRVVLQPWLMRQGYLLYEHIADEHPPLMYLLLSAVQSPGLDSLILAKVVTALLVCIITLLAFWVGQRTGGWLAGIFSAFFFAVWSPLFGYGKLWHETFLAPLYVLLLIQWRPPLSRNPNIRSSIVTGFLLGLALLTKQHAAVVVLGLVLWHTFISWRAHRPIHHALAEIMTIALAAALPIAVFTIHHLMQVGTVKNLVFWTITFSFVNNYTQLASRAPQMTQILYLAPAYLLLPAFVLRLWASRAEVDGDWSREGWALVLLVTSSVTAYPRFGLFHLQASLPILAWLSGTTITRLLNARSQNSLERISHQSLLTGMACSLIILWTLYAGSTYYTACIRDRPQKIWEYTDLLPLAGEIRQRIGPDDCIYLFPDDEATANLYYLTQCRPPHFWMPTSYPWFTLDVLKPKVVQSLEQASPEWVVYFPERWGIEQHGQEILNYIQDKYQLETTLSWADGEVQLLQRRSD